MFLTSPLIEHAAAEMEQSKTRNHRARHKTRASLLSDKGLDAANHNPRFRWREKNVLDIPSYRTGEYTQNPRLRVDECKCDLSTTTFSESAIMHRASLHFGTYFKPSSPSYCRITP